MKKLLVLVVVLGVGAWFAWARLLRPAPKRACAHLHALCGHSPDAEDDAKDCDDFFDTVSKNDGDKTIQCVLDAKTCPEALGCSAGGAIKLGTTAAKGFLNGFSKTAK